MSPLIVLSPELRVAGLRRQYPATILKKFNRRIENTMFIETKMFLFVGVLLLNIETVTSCGESGRLIIYKYLGKVSKMESYFHFLNWCYISFLWYSVKNYFFKRKDRLKITKTSSFIHYLIFDFYRTFFVSWSARLCNCQTDLTTEKVIR